jgi:hypothetical protein
MQAAELKSRINQSVTPDFAAQRAICRAFRTLREFLEEHVTDQRGLTGWVFRKLFPRTAEGIRAVVQLLKDYEQQQCA